MPRSIPPELQGFLAALAAKGINVEVIEVGGEDSSDKQGETGNQQTAEPEITRSERAMLDTIAEGLEHLHKHLCPRITNVAKNSLTRDNELKDRIADLERRADTNRTLLTQRDLQVGGAIGNLENQLSLQAQQIENLKGELLELGEIVRRQVGLLHKRVTKRKTAIAKVARKTRTKIEG